MSDLIRRQDVEKAIQELHVGDVCFFEKLRKNIDDIPSVEMVRTAKVEKKGMGGSRGQEIGDSGQGPEMNEGGRMKNEEKLVRCGCGGKAVVRKGQTNNCWWVECSQCRVTTMFGMRYSQTDAINAWNKAMGAFGRTEFWEDDDEQ